MNTKETNMSNFSISQSNCINSRLTSEQSSLAADDASTSEEEEKCSTSSDAPEQRQCEQCSALFDTEAKLIRHLLCHTIIVPARCQLCRKNFSKQSRLAEHIMCVHGGVKRFACTFCSARFSWRSTYMRHLRRQHGSSDNHPSTSASTSSVSVSSLHALQHECEHCSAIFTQRRELVKHVRQNHQDMARDQAAMKVEQCTTVKVQNQTSIPHHQEQQQQIEAQTTFRCSMCNFFAPNHSMLAQHVATHIYAGAFSYQSNTQPLQSRAVPVVREELISNAVQAQFCSFPASVPNSPVFHCPLCSAIMPSRVALEQHVNSQHSRMLPQQSMVRQPNLTMMVDVAPFQLYFDEDNEPRVLLNL